MRIAMVTAAGREGIAIAENDVFRILWQDDPTYPGDLDAVVQRGGSLIDLARLAGETVVDTAAIRFLPPLRRSRKILCVGLNYRSHAEESRMAPSAHPEIFLRVGTSLAGHNTMMPMPPQAVQLDYEAELVAIVGRSGKCIAHADALDHIVGYTAFNDITLRDYQFRTSQWTLGKNFDGSGVCGPWLVDAADLPPGATGLRITTTLNGKIVQDANTADLIFDVATLVANLSETMTLEAGDMIVTGTPGGVGMARTPPLWMKSGDTVEVAIERIGSLQAHIA